MLTLYKKTIFLRKKGNANLCFPKLKEIKPI